jgi:hypothetical protein
MKKLLSILFISITLGVSAQNDIPAKEPTEFEKEITHTLENLFKGMQTSDSALVHSTFHNNVSMRTTYINKKTNKPTIIQEELSEFLTAIGTPKKESWNERISNLIIHVDGNLAQTWMDYSFYIDENFSHCGVNSIQLIRLEDGWKISDIADTRRRIDCNEPAQVNKK